MFIPAFRLYCAAVHLCDLLCDRQPQSCAAGGSRTGSVSTEKLFEDTVQLFRRNGTSGVAYGQYSVILPWRASPEK